MSKKKKGTIYYLKKIYGGIKWFFSNTLKLIKWIINFGKKANKKRKEIETEGKRPKKEAIYAQFLELETLDGNLEDFENNLYSKKSLIGLILGARGSGKSAIGIKILENIKEKTNKKIYAIGFNREDLPTWITNTDVENLDKIKNNSFVLVDEGGIEFSSRSSMSNANKLLSELLLISRHRDLSVLFCSQNSSNIEINTIRQSDYLILKSPALLQLDFERKKIKEIYKKVLDKFKKYKKEKGLTYIYSDQYRGFISNKLPSFWSTEMSKSYKNKK